MLVLSLGRPFLSRVLFAFVSLFSLCFLSSQALAAVVYSNGFESMPLGNTLDPAVKTAWSTRYASGPDEGRMRIVEGGTFAHTGRAAEVKYPANAHSTSDSGDTWETGLGVNADEMYLSYWVKFDANFQFVKGGKMPGLAGGTGFPSADAFTVRLMWREEGKLEFYLHGFKVNNSAGAEPYRIFWDDFGTHAKVVAGQWHHIEIRVKLNTPGLRDGLLEGWLDGQLAVQETDNSGIRAVGESARKINFLFFSTFFGGSSPPVSQWQPTSDVFAYFDDFTVSTTSVGSGSASSAAASSTPASSVPASSTPASSAAASSVPSGTCQTLTGTAAVEFDLTSSTCILTGGLTDKTLSVWDSDTNPSCDFRGTVTSMDGNGSLAITTNYHDDSMFTGTKLNFAANNGCKYVKVRVL